MNAVRHDFRIQELSLNVILLPWIFFLEMIVPLFHNQFDSQSLELCETQSSRNTDHNREFASENSSKCLAIDQHYIPLLKIRGIESEATRFKGSRNARRISATSRALKAPTN